MSFRLCKATFFARHVSISHEPLKLGVYVIIGMLQNKNATKNFNYTSIADRLKAAVSQIFTELWLTILFHQKF